MCMYVHVYVCINNNLTYNIATVKFIVTYRIYLNMLIRIYPRKINKGLAQIFTIFPYDQNIDEIGDDQTSNQCQHLFGPLQLHELHLSHPITNSIAVTLFPSYSFIFSRLPEFLRKSSECNEWQADDESGTYTHYMFISEIVICSSGIRLLFLVNTMLLITITTFFLWCVSCTFLANIKIAFNLKIWESDVS